MNTKMFHNISSKNRAYYYCCILFRNRIVLQKWYVYQENSWGDIFCIILVVFVIILCTCLMGYIFSSHTYKMWSYHCIAFSKKNIFINKSSMWLSQSINLQILSLSCWKFITYKWPNGSWYSTEAWWVWRMSRGKHTLEINMKSTSVLFMFVVKVDESGPIRMFSLSSYNVDQDGQSSLQKMPTTSC